MSQLSGDMDDIDVAGAMLLIQQRGGDKPTFAETGTGALEGKDDGPSLATQSSVPGQAKIKKTAVAPKDNAKGGATAPPVFVYDNYDWQTYEVFDLHNANATLQFVNSPAEVARSAKNRPDASGAKRKIVVQAGERAARKVKKKFKKRDKKVKKSKTGAGASAATAPHRGAASHAALQHEQLMLEIEILNRRLAEKTAKLERAKSLRNKASDLQNSQQRASGLSFDRGWHRQGAAKQAPRNTTAKNACFAGTRYLEMQIARHNDGQTGAASAARNSQHLQQGAAHKTPSESGAGFISLTEIADGGKFKFAEAKAFRVDEPDDDKTIPPLRLKMAEWETQVNRGQWRRLRRFTDCKRCFGHCGASHKKDNGCLAAQEVRRYKLKKHYMDIQRRKMKELKRANNMFTKEERRKIARTMNMAKKNSISQMSVKQRALLKKKAMLPCCV